MDALLDSDILICDDSQAIRSYVQAMLQDFGLPQAREAQDGNAALALCRAKAPHILICDLAMPGMDGVELLRALAQENHKLSVIPMSSLETRLRFSVSEMAAQLGLRVLGVLGKPFEQEDLREALLRHVDASAIRPRLEAMSEGDLADAIKMRRVCMHFQPQVRISDGQLVGAEALVRLEDRAGQLISPDAFIAMSEDTGQIHRLSHLIITASLRQLGLWHKQSLNLKLSINLSAAALKKLDLPEHIEAIARSHGLSNDAITVELTETQLPTGPELFDVMARFRMRGFGLAIDDYGTGDSGLTRLRALPFTELKVDQRFVKNCHLDAELQTILASSIRLGHELGMQVVAEGVQSRDEWQFLAQQGCDIGQGFLIGRPLPAEEFMRWSQQWARQEQAAFSNGTF